MERSGKKESDDPDKRTVCAEGFFANATLGRLTSFFELFGRVEHVEMCRDEENKFEGTCVVVFETVEGAEAFIDSNKMFTEDGIPLLKLYVKDYRLYKDLIKKHTETADNKNSSTTEKKNDGSSKDEKSKGFWGENAMLKKICVGTLAGLGAGAAVAVAIPVAVGVIGFGAGGVVAGSTAAAMMSAVGNVAAGSAIATMQSIGAAGLASATTAGLVGGGAAVGTATAAGIAAATSGTDDKDDKDDKPSAPPPPPPDDSKEAIKAEDDENKEDGKKSDSMDNKMNEEKEDKERVLID